jgi:hypothetical protein
LEGVGFEELLLRQQKAGMNGVNPWPGIAGTLCGDKRIAALVHSGHCGRSGKETGTESTGTGTIGVFQTFSAGSCGEVGAMGTSDKRFPQRVRARCSPSLNNVSPSRRVTFFFVQ